MLSQSQMQSQSHRQLRVPAALSAPSRFTISTRTSTSSFSTSAQRPCDSAHRQGHRHGSHASLPRASPGGPLCVKAQKRFRQPLDTGNAGPMQQCHLLHLPPSSSPALSLPTPPPATSLTHRERRFACSSGGGESGVEGATNNSSGSNNGSVAAASSETQMDPAAALRALDRQLSDLALEGTADHAEENSARAESRGRSERGSASGGQPEMMQIGRGASGEGWPEFDATWFTITSILLLLVTAFTNLIFYFATPRPERPSQENQSPVTALYMKSMRGEN